MRPWSILICAALAAALICGIAPADAATYCVSPVGNDTNPGTADRPFLTVQKGLNTAQPGDTVHVMPGLYRERVIFPRGGEKGKPITLEGEWGAVLDGGETVKGWQPAAEIGPGVFKTAAVSYFPRVTTWQNKVIHSIHAKAVEGVRAWKGQTVKDWLKMPAQNDGYAPSAQYKLDNWWDATEMFVTQLDKELYYRERNGRAPGNDVATAPDGSCVIKADKKDFLVIRGLTCRTAEWGIRVSGSDCIIEDNYVYSCGKAGILLADGGARNHVRNNELTWNFVYADHGHPWHSPQANRIWGLIKSVGFGDDMGIRLEDHGDDNLVYGNHIYRCFDGIAAKSGLNHVGGQHCRIFNNIVQNVADDGLGLDGDETNTEYHDNLFIEPGNDAIVFDGYPHSKGPCYIYRNRCHFTQTTNGGWGMHFKNKFSGTVQLYIYQNTFVANTETWTVNGDWAGVPTSQNILFLNNIASSASFYGDTWPPNQQYGVGCFDYNWIGGKRADYLAGKPSFGPHNVVAKDLLLWPDLTKPSFLLAADSPARGKGADLSKPFTVFGKEHPALPGMKPGYFTGAAPDMGAIQFGQDVKVAAPSDLTVTVAGGKAALRWKDNSDNESGFLVERSVDGKVFVTIRRTAANATSFTDDAPNAAECAYRVRAINVKDGAWVSDFSDVAPKVERP